MYTRLYQNIARLLTNRLLRPVGMVRVIGVWVGVCFVVMTATAFSQVFSLSVKEATLSSVFNTIMKQSKYTFFYDNREVKKGKKVTVEIRNGTIEELMNEVMKGQPLTYSIVDKTIVVRKKEDVRRRETGEPDSQSGSGKSTTVKSEEIRNEAIPSSGIKEAPSGRNTSDIPVTGKVVDEKGEGLPGVSVAVKGSTKGTLTDSRGNFYLSVQNDEAVLVFSYVGYLPQEVSLKSRSALSITLKVDQKALEEVVVVGYGSQRKRDLTGSVASIKSSDIVSVPTLGLDQAMQGRAPGVFVSNNNANPGGAVNIRIRGTNSIQGNNEPLYVVDGYIGGNINSVNPSDIESIEVLKDASSTAIYGARGANGVVLVTTKGGKEGRSRINVDALYGFQSARKKIDMMNARQYAIFVNAVDADRGAATTYPDLNNLGNDTDWQDAILRNAPWQQYSVSSGGGTDKLKYYVSGAYVGQDGIVKETRYNRFNLRANIDARISDRISFGTRLGFSRINRTQQQGEEIGRNDDTGHPVSRSLLLQPTAPAFDQNGSTLPTVMDYTNTLRGNPLFDLENNYQKQFSTNFTGTLFAEIKILRSLRFRTSAGFDVLSQKSNRYKPSTTFDTNIGYKNTASVGTTFVNGWLVENYLTFDTKSGKHAIQAVGGSTLQGSNSELASISVSDFAIDDFQFNNLAAGATVNSYSSDMSQWRQASFFGRVNYTWNDRYIFTFNGRYDGSSKFGKEHKWGFFPSGAVAWRLSDEPFVSRLGLFSDLKLRASYGISGSEALAPYKSLAVMDAFAGAYVIGNAPVVGYYTSQLPNPDLRWEQTAQLDIGLDASVLNGRLSFVLDYFDKRTKDLFLNMPLPQTSGVGSIQYNIGSLRNSGMELGVNATAIEGPLRWVIGVNATLQRSEILALAGQEQIITGAIQGGYGNIDGMQLMRVGLPLGAFYGYKTAGTWSTSDDLGAYTQFGTVVKAGDQKMVDVNGDGNVNADDRQVLGYAQPKWFGGFNNTFTFKGFDLSLFAQFVAGNKILNGAAMAYRNTGSYSNKHVDLINVWTPDNQNTNIPRAGSVMQRQVMDFYIEDGSFIRLRELTLGYSFPQAVLSRLGIARVRLYATAANLLTFTRYSGYDPEVNIAGGSVSIINFDNGSYPRARSIIMGLNLSF